LVYPCPVPKGREWEVLVNVGGSHKVVIRGFGQVCGYRRKTKKLREGKNGSDGALCGKSGQKLARTCIPITFISGRGMEKNIAFGQAKIRLRSGALHERARAGLELDVTRKRKKKQLIKVTLIK